MEKAWRMAEVVSFLGFNRKKIYELIKYEGLPARKAGRDWVFNEGQVREWFRCWTAGLDYEAGREHVAG